MTIELHLSDVELTEAMTDQFADRFNLPDCFCTSFGWDEEQEAYIAVFDPVPRKSD